jgi:hypothetical protein
LKNTILILLFVLFTGNSVIAQLAQSDSVLTVSEIRSSDIQLIDTVAVLVKATKSEFKPDPVRVLWMGAIIPGYGQILNRSYWKLPIVYAGFLGCTYAITLNSTRYETYRLAYKDIIDSNDNTNSYLEILPEGYTIDNYPGGKSGLEANLLKFYEQYRRNRDLSIIVSVAYYGLTLVEAYVDAQLFDFDISNDLSMHIRPALLQNNFGKTNSAGVQLSFKLK